MHICTKELVKRSTQDLNTFLCLVPFEKAYDITTLLKMHMTSNTPQAESQQRLKETVESCVKSCLAVPEICQRSLVQEVSPTFFCLLSSDGPWAFCGGPDHLFTSSSNHNTCAGHFRHKPSARPWRSMRAALPVPAMH